MLRCPVRQQTLSCNARWQKAWGQQKNDLHIISPGNRNQQENYLTLAYTPSFFGFVFTLIGTGWSLSAGKAKQNTPLNYLNLGTILLYLTGSA